MTMIVDDYSSDSPISCYLEVDLDYPDRLHDLHNDHPLAGEKIEIKKEIMSNYQLQIIEHINVYFGKNKKLIPNLDNKRKYKLHYQNLKFYLGLQLKKIHRIL